MEFVNVQTQPLKNLSKGLNIYPSVLKHTPNLLFSLEHAYDKYFSKKSIDTFAANVLRIKSTYVHQNPIFWMDSGGYAFIKKRFSVDQYKDMIGGYCYFLENFSSKFEYIFSLDFPCRKGIDPFNKNDALIKKINLESLVASKRIVIQSPNILDKFYLAIQFLHGNQYEIWRELCRETGFDQIVRNRALGGMVGVRASKHSISSPFIAMAYRCLVDFMKSQHAANGGEFKLHFLGVYLLQDRFAISFLEKLFSTYLPSNKIKFTYDSSAYSKKGMLGHLTLPAFIPFGSDDYQYLGGFDAANIGTDLDLSKIKSLKNLQLIFDESNIETARAVMEKADTKREFKLLKDIAAKIYNDKFKKDYKSKKSGNLAVFQPFNALNNNCQDEIVSKCIDRFELVRIFQDLKSAVEAVRFANDTIINISHSNKKAQKINSDLRCLNENIIFSNLHLLWTIRRNLILTYDLHEWFINRRDDEGWLDEKVKEKAREFFTKGK